MQHFSKSKAYKILLIKANNHIIQVCLLKIPVQYHKDHTYQHNLVSIT